jgi:hypothetical protein
VKRPSVSRTRAIVALVAVVVVIGTVVAWRVRARTPRPSGASRRGSGRATDAPRPRIPDVGPIDPGDPFPLDGRLRIFDTRQGRAGDGMILFERVATRRERLSDGHEYLVFETLARMRSTGEGRVVSREWLRRAPDGILCRRRQEGPSPSDLDPPQCVVALPLDLGKTWSWSGTSDGRRSGMKCTVVARERVTVGAGTFQDAWRIDSEVWTEDPPRDEVRRSLWLQPGVGLIEERATIGVDGRTLQLDAALVEVIE